MIIVIVHAQNNPPNPPVNLANITPPAAPSGPPITDCTRFNANQATVGQLNGPVCPTGTEKYGGICYTDTWTAEGGTKTAVCTVDWGTYGGVYTQCGIGIYDLNYGDPCPMVGPGYHKTAWCTCQLRGPITAGQYCQSEGGPSQCPEGWDFFGGICTQAACPSGTTRTGICTCTTNT